MKDKRTKKQLEEILTFLPLDRTERDLEVRRLIETESELIEIKFSTRGEGVYVAGIRFYLSLDDNRYVHYREYQYENTLRYRIKSDFYKTDRHKKYAKEYYKKNKARMIQNAKNWQKANPERFTELKEKYKAQKENNNK